MKAIILGAGKMGVAIGYAMKIFGFDISIIETNQDNINKFKSINGECESHPHWNNIKPEADIVISALPYTENVDAAGWAIANKLRYCDLGGSVPVSKRIKEMSEAASKPVMTDLGLAPGWVNILAEEVYKQFPKTDTVKIMVGGIPPFPVKSDPLNYKLTWSMEGLLNEYMDDCEALSCGHKIIVCGLTDVENVIVDGIELEAFFTSGASSHSIPLMKDRGVKNCCYKTLRYRGHAAMMNYLLSTKDRQLVETLLAKSSEHHQSDVVVMTAIASRYPDVKVEKSVRIVPSKGFTAMQVATAFPIATVANMLAYSQLDKFKYPSYADIDLAMFNDDLDLLLNKKC